MNFHKALDEVLQDKRLFCGAVIDELGHVLFRAGDFPSYPAQGLISSALGPHGTARETYFSLEGQELPAIWAEGEYFALIDRPEEGVAFIFFGVPKSSPLAFLRPRSGEQEAVTLMGYSKRISQRLRESLAR